MSSLRPSFRCSQRLWFKQPYLAGVRRWGYDGRSETTLRCGRPAL